MNLVSQTHLGQLSQTRSVRLAPNESNWLAVSATVLFKVVERSITVDGSNSDQSTTTWVLAGCSIKIPGVSLVRLIAWLLPQTAEY